MCELDSTTRRSLAVIVAALIGASACGTESASGCGCQPHPDGAYGSAPQPWDGSTDKTIHLKTTDEGVLELSQAASTLELVLPGDRPNWSHTSRSSLQILRGSSSLPLDASDRTATFQTTLLVAPGNPQIAVSSKLQYPSDTPPAETVDLSVRFPAGGDWKQATDERGARSIAPPTEIPAWRFPWLQHRDASGGDAVTLWGWNGNGVILTEERGKSARVDFRIWRPKASQPCSPAESATRDIRAGGTIAFGNFAPAVVATLPDGRAGAAVPVFLPPKVANNPPLWQGGPDDPSEWSDRLRTLSFGHSNPDDPRFGNGGLIGRNFGATLTWPDSLFAADTFEEARESIASDSIDLAAPIGAAFESEPPSVRTDLKSNASDRDTCSAQQRRTDIIIKNGPTIDRHLPTPLSPNESIAEGSLALPDGAGPVVATVAHTDGSRSTLTDSLLTEETINRIAEHREVMVLGIPLIATRNPLLPAFDEGLLTPERWHRWTMASDVSSAFTSVNLASDAGNVGIIGLGRLTGHWKNARQTHLRWTAGGKLRVHNHSGETIDGYTIVYPGTDPDGPKEMRIRTAGDGGYASLTISSDAPAEMTWPEERTSNVAPVNWQLDVD